MLRIRMVEEAIADRYAEQEMRCPVHLCIGQEAIPAGVCAQLNTEDQVFGNHRSHGHYLAKGGGLKAMVAEMYGKATGCSRGKGGSMHLIDLSVQFMGSTPIVGSIIPIAVGAAFSAWLKKESRVVVVFFGRAATEEGVFAESLNFASLKKLPVVFVSEDNFFSVYTPLQDRQPAGRNNLDLARSLGIPADGGDGNDVEFVFEKTGAAVRHAREGKGPSFLEFQTYRWREHCGPFFDNQLGYRPEAEYEEWVKRCPVGTYERRLIHEGRLPAADAGRMREDIQNEIQAAFQFAKDSPFPEIDQMGAHIYADDAAGPPGKVPRMTREITFSQALHEAADHCLAEDPSVYVLGLGVPDPKGVFGTTAGLQEKYGPDRVMDMPVSENAMTGVAIGSAMTGMRPIMTHQRIDFMLLSLDQVINNAAKWHYMFGGQLKAPLVIRLLVGRGWGQGPQHSQSLQALFAHIPGLKVVCPFSPHDAKGLLIAAVRDPNPVIFIEHRWLHGLYGPVPEG
ncbi:MAG: dehydrogenase E1 component subunit alpha/beta, partial [Nitrospinaceae bacterium]